MSQDMAMRRTRASFVYLVSYLSVGGFALLVAPDRALRLLGATLSYPSEFVRFAAAFMVALAIAVTQIARHRLEVLYPTTVLVRVPIVATLLAVYFDSRDRVFLVLTMIVGFGMLLTTAGLLSDGRAREASTLEGRSG
jgi:hypothetical protein